ncbi:MAG: DUF4377 domain-containing protein [Bacteroidales bacterium]|nr:DUF4377 domain-containing protein [Bacteroidales bacterium]
MFYNQISYHFVRQLFDYEPGYEYYISVEVYEQVPPYIADKDWYTMVLMEINSKESKNSFE